MFTNLIQSSQRDLSFQLGWYLGFDEAFNWPRVHGSPSANARSNLNGCKVLGNSVFSRPHIRLEGQSPKVIFGTRAASARGETMIKPGKRSQDASRKRGPCVSYLFGMSKLI